MTIGCEKWDILSNFNFTAIFRDLFFIGVLMTPYSIICQNISGNLKTELVKIDSIVKSIDENGSQFYEGIVEGPIIYKGLFKRNGGWEAYYLNDKEFENIPIRIRYNLAHSKTYENYQFYYDTGSLVFVNLKVKYYKKGKKDESFERQYYFKNNKLIYDSHPNMETYNLNKVLLEETTMRKICFE